MIRLISLGLGPLMTRRVTPAYLAFANLRTVADEL